MTVTTTELDGAGASDPDLLEPREPLRRVVPWLLTVGGALGLFSALDLNIERGRLLEDPSYVPSCSINPVVDCGAVATSEQASVFGFSNTLLGVVGFTVVVTVGMLLLMGGRLPRPMWLGLNAGLLLGVVFVHWLISQSLFSIGILCPYCMVVWSVTVPMFWYVTLRNLANGAFGGVVAESAAVRTLVGIHAVPVVLWFVTIATMIGVVFADNWADLL